MDVGVISACFGEHDFEEYWEYLYPTQKRYCDKYGLDFTLYREDLTPDNFFPTWSKILALKENIDNYDWLIWLDADLMIMNHTVDIREWIDDDYNFIVEKDLSDRNRLDDPLDLNTGFMFLKGKSEWSKKFLHEIYFDDNIYANNRRHPYHEQSSMEMVLRKRDSFLEKILVRENVLHKYWPKFPCKLESWVKREDRDRATEFFIDYAKGRTFREGDFSSHFIGTSKKIRANLYELAQKFIVWDDNSSGDFDDLRSPYEEFIES